MPKQETTPSLSEPKSLSSTPARPSKKRSPSSTSKRKKSGFSGNKSLTRARAEVDNALREFSVMTFMPRKGICFDEAVAAREEKFGTGTPDFWVTYLRLVARRIRYLADRAEARDIKRRKETS
jgi:hypothetical protein